MSRVFVQCVCPMGKTEAIAVIENPRITKRSCPLHFFYKAKTKLKGKF